MSNNGYLRAVLSGSQEWIIIMKVLHLLCSDTFSGAENVVCQIINMTKDIDGVEMVYCSRDGSIRESVGDRGIKFVPVADVTPDEVKKVIASEKPDVIHAHDMRASFVASRAVGKIPLICHIHNNAFDARSISPKSVAFLLAAVKAKHIFWVSDSAAEGYAFAKMIKSKSSVLYNIIDTEELVRRRDTDESEYSDDVVYLGRFSNEKNPTRLIEVFAGVAARIPGAKLGMVGSGDMEEAVRAKINELNLTENVTLYGFRKNPLKILSSAAVMVMTSLWEGLPMCALEAQALGVPIVSTPTDGLKIVITDGENGYLSDDNEVLTQRICDIISDGELRKKLSDSSKAFSDRFNDRETYVGALMNEYKRGLGE